MKTTTTKETTNQYENCHPHKGSKAAAAWFPTGSRHRAGMGVLCLAELRRDYPCEEAGWRRPGRASRRVISGIGEGRSAGGGGQLGALARALPLPILLPSILLSPLPPFPFLSYHTHSYLFTFVYLCLSSCLTILLILSLTLNLVGQ